MRTVRVGLTGLRRAGKTVFLTAIAHNFTQHDGSSLGEFEHRGWMYRGKLLEGSAMYRENRMALTDGCWPPQTTEERKIKIELTLEGTRRKRKCIVELVDYPGERLADVLLLDSEYQRWSRDFWEAEEANPDLREAEEANPDLRESLMNALLTDGDRSIDHAKEQYGNYVRSKLGLARMHAPIGPALSDSPAPFFPLPSPENVIREKRVAVDLALQIQSRYQSLLAHFEKEYSEYCRQEVVPFVSRVATCSHQIILIDVREILRQGPDRHWKVRETMMTLMSCLSKTQPSIWARIAGRPALKRISFCVTKVDEATRTDRPNLISLLRQLVNTAVAEAKVSLRSMRRDPDYLGISAFRSTTDVEENQVQQAMPGLQGRPIGSERRLIVNPGRIPRHWPETRDEWEHLDPLPVFQPRQASVVNDGTPLPNIGMDQIMYRILEDVHGERTIRGN